MFFQGQVTLFSVPFSCTHLRCTVKVGTNRSNRSFTCDFQSHETGRMKIKLDTDEEIAKWREERKRQPTCYLH